MTAHRARGPKHPERSFGLSVGGVLLVAAALLVWRGRTGRAEWAGGAGLVLVVFGWLRPLVLKPLSDAWWKMAGALGWFNARLLLTIAFALVMTPLGLLWRLTGRDPLARRKRSWTGWAPAPARYRDPRHFDRMF
jgi:hypothetical protein